MQINKEWHLNNLMPKNPTLEERISWHIEHSKKCNCRKMPESIKKEAERRIKNAKA
ncbi:MAG: hypothetical protein ACM34M_00605 [Ignavibacteria bacterium]